MLHWTAWYDIGLACLLAYALVAWAIGVGRLACFFRTLKHGHTLSAWLLRPLDEHVALEAVLGLLITIPVYAIVMTGGATQMWSVLLVAGAVPFLTPSDFFGHTGKAYSGRWFWLSLGGVLLVSVLSFVQLKTGRIIEINGDQLFYYRLARLLLSTHSEAITLHQAALPGLTQALHPVYHYYDIWWLSGLMQLGLSAPAASALVFKSVCTTLSIALLARLLRELSGDRVGWGMAFAIAAALLMAYVVVPIGRIFQNEAVQSWAAPFAMIDRLDNVVYRHKIALFVLGALLLSVYADSNHLVLGLALGAAFWFLSPLYLLVFALGLSVLVLRPKQVILHWRSYVGVLGLSLVATALLLLNSTSIDQIEGQAADSKLMFAKSDLWADVAVTLAVGALAYLSFRRFLPSATLPRSRQIVAYLMVLSLVFVLLYHSPLPVRYHELFQTRIVFWWCVLLLLLLMALGVALTHLATRRRAWVIAALALVLVLSQAYLIYFFQLGLERRYLMHHPQVVTHRDCAALACLAHTRGALYVSEHSQPRYPSFTESQLQLCPGLEVVLDLPTPATIASLYDAAGQLIVGSSVAASASKLGFLLQFPYFVAQQPRLHARRDYDSLAVRYTQQYDITWIVASRHDSLSAGLRSHYAPSGALCDPGWVLYLRRGIAPIDNCRAPSAAN